jgi:regulator of replication initiation timing
MEWVLIGIILVLLIVTLNQNKKLKEQTHSAMTEFASRMEQEHDELYNKMVAYTKLNESKLEDRIKALEDKLIIHETITENQKPDNSEQKDEITQMYKQGFSTDQITKILQVEQGKVELIINMYRKSKASN